MTGKQRVWRRRASSAQAHRSGGGARAPETRTRSLRSHLLTLVIVVLLPAALFAGGLLVLLWREQQHALRESLQQTARAMTLAVDRQIESSIKSLAVLADGESLVQGRIDEFHREARRQVAINEDWLDLLLLGRDGQQLIHTARSLGGALPHLGELDYVRRVVQDGEAVISDAFVSPVSGKWVVHVAVPVLRRGALEYVLVASLNLHGFDDFLREQAVPADGMAAILDRKEHFVARSRSSEQYRGQYPNASLLDKMRSGHQGTGRFPSLDGPATYSAWSRSPHTGWTVTVGIPAAAVEASLRSSLLMLVGIGIIAFVGAGALAFWLHRRIVDPISSAARGAMALARRETVPAISSRITEVQELCTALGRASGVLQVESEERERAEQQRAELLEREQASRQAAEAASRAKDEFIAMLGHELRNPLAPIMTAVELMKLKGDVPTPRERTIIERQAQHLTRLVNDLLDVSRIVRGKVTLRKEPVELSDVVAKGVEMASPLLESKGHRLTIDVPARGMLLMADEGRLAQVFSNLLTNAAKFTDAGGDVGIVAERRDDEVIVRVKDSGAGITGELLPRVFDLFIQGKRSADRQEGGLGLGLALVRGFVERHGGTVSAHSDGPGRGSEFVIRLPALPVETQAPAGIARLASWPAACGSRVLVVDDNLDAALMLGELLSAAGHEVRLAQDGAQALAIAEDFEPDVAVLDIGLPVMDGYELAEHLRARTTHAPYLIALTGYGTEQDRARSRALGFSVHLVKPVSAEKLVAAVSEAAPHHASP